MSKSRGLSATRAARGGVRVRGAARGAPRNVFPPHGGPPLLVLSDQPHMSPASRTPHPAPPSFAALMHLSITSLVCGIARPLCVSPPPTERARGPRLHTAPPPSLIIIRTPPMDYRGPRPMSLNPRPGARVARSLAWQGALALRNSCGASARPRVAHSVVAHRVLAKGRRWHPATFLAMRARIIEIYP